MQRVLYKPIYMITSQSSLSSYTNKGYVGSGVDSLNNTYELRTAAMGLVIDHVIL